MKLAENLRRSRVQTLRGEKAKVMMVKEECKKRVLNFLPLKSSLPDGRHVVIDYMTSTQLTETYNLIQDAAQAGDGYGVDEFISEPDFRNQIQDGDAFGIMLHDTRELLAAFILAVSKYYRGEPTVADPYIIVTKQERHHGIGYYCMQKSVEFAQRLGYIGLYVDTFTNNIAVQKILENFGGFTKVGYLPAGGRMRNGEIVGSFIYYRDLVSK